MSVPLSMRPWPLLVRPPGAGLIINQSVLESVAGQIGGSLPQDATAAGQATPGRPSGDSEPPATLDGHRVLDLSIGKDSPGAGRRPGSISWPLSGTPVSVLRHRRLQEPDPDLTLADGDRVSLLVAATQVVPRELADAGGRGPAQRPARRASRAGGRLAWWSSSARRTARAASRHSTAERRI
ncbi:MAG TPA: TrkA C-terminal domain-containing protein [Streptosporangiaceae bacterium]|nr:TrkA C-terminal domain-containing protein [Streptosporangiaceae bacterium]